MSIWDWGDPPPCWEKLPNNPIKNQCFPKLQQKMKMQSLRQWWVASRSDGHCRGNGDTTTGRRPGPSCLQCIVQHQIKPNQLRNIFLKLFCPKPELSCSFMKFHYNLFCTFPKQCWKLFLACQPRWKFLSEYESPTFPSSQIEWLYFTQFITQCKEYRASCATTEAVSSPRLV